jgi:ubiquinone/menaquinone biosynthesis C-methylase UbiE
MPQSSKTTPEYWDARAREVHNEHELVYNSAAHFAKNDSIARLLIREFVKKDMRVLDIGCGYGRFYEEIVRAGGDYTGIDFSAEMIKRAQTKYPDGKFLERSWLDHFDKYDVVFECICFSSFARTMKDFRMMMEQFSLPNDGICIMVEPTDIRVWSGIRNLFA